MDMMQGAGVTEEGRKAMRKLMQSDRAPQAMANMMEMARRMGNGDVMLGMTHMMEMLPRESVAARIAFEAGARWAVCPPAR